MTEVTQYVEQGMKPFRVSTDDGEPRISVALYGHTWRYAEREAKRLFPALRGRQLATEAIEETQP